MTKSKMSKIGSKKFVLLLLVIGVLPFYTSTVRAWGLTGHRVVAEVAYHHLTKKAHKKVDQVLGKHGMVYWAKWADEIRSDSTLYPGSDVWHYQDDPIGGELFVKYDSLVTVLTQNPNDTDALKFVVHLTADRYNPAHLAKTEDAGMNKIKIMWFGSPSNMHKVWDEGIVDSEGYSYSEYAQMLEDKYSHQRAELEKLTLEEATVQTKQLIHRIYEYQEQWNGNAYQYIYEWRDEVRWQLYAAGIRLAQVLNAIYR